MKKDAKSLMSKKGVQKITMLTCYDYPTAVLEDKAGIDMVLVGDSVGTNVLGYRSETEVTMADMVHHLKAVRRGINETYLLVDMPYRSYDNPEQALETARTFISCGADGVKLEGVKTEIVRHLVKNGIEVVGHVGLNPQTHIKKAVQGKTFDGAKELIEGSLLLQEAGAFMIVLELMPEELAKIITERLRIPTIGIAAGRFCDGQVLVVNDLLGMTDLKLRHVKKYQDYISSMHEAFARYKNEVEAGTFPGQENVIRLAPEEYKKISDWLKADGSAGMHIEK